MVYSLVEKNQEPVWMETLLTTANIDKFLVILDWSHVSSSHFLTGLVAPRDKKRPTIISLEKEGK